MIPPPLSVQGAPLKTCGAMDLLKNAADDRAILEQQPRPRQHQQQQPQPQEQHKSGEALEPKHIIKGVDSEVGSLTGHSDFGWAASVSEGSVSSMDSFHGGETLYSPTEYHHPSLFRKPRPGVHMSESLVLSDDEPAPDLVDQSFSKRRGASSGMEEVAPDHGSTPSEDFPCPRVKFMCSFGGKILPRPVDGTLRYVGGETRIITVPRDITYTDLMFKMTEFYGHALTLKYQLPKEELDALVSVSSDEDLENMMEEYDKIEASDQSSRLRVFLFNCAEYDMAPLSEHLGYARDSEQRYVDAVNGLLEPVVPRKQSEGASSSTAQTSAPVDNLLDVDPPWVNDHAAAIAAGAVPLARLVPAVSQDVASLIHQVPVAVPVVSASISSYQYAPPVVVSSAPLSAPSSPPNAIRSGLVAPPAIADLFFQDPQMPSLDPLAGHLYSGKPPGDAGYQDVEAYAGTTAPSSAGGHDAQFRGVDTRRAPESPPKSHFLPRPSSYGKLADLDRGGRVDHMDGLSQFDLHRLVLQQQPWQHPVDVQPDPYRRADVPAHDAVVPTLQNGAAAAFGPPPQLQPLHFRPGLSGHDAVYWQRDQSLPQAQQQQQNEDVYSVSHFHRSVSAHQLHQPGSSPSSPRLGYSNVPGWQLGGQQQQQQPKYHRHYAHSDGQYARVVHGYGDQGSRPLAVSPPRHRDRDHFQPPPGDDRVSRQQQVPAGGVALASGPLLNSEAGPSSEQHAGTVLPSALPQSLYSEVLPRGTVPQYVVLNPYAEGLVPVHEHQDSGESRRHILAHGLEPGVAMAPQPHYLLPVQGQRAPSDSTSFHSRYADADWGTQQRVHDERLRPSGRAWVGQPNYLEDSPVLDVGGSQSAPSSYSTFLPEDADVLQAQDPFVSQHPRSKRVMDDVVHGRPASLTGGTGAGFGKGRGLFVETTQVVHQLPGRSAENELQLAASMPVVGSVAIGLPGNNQVLVDEHKAGNTFNQPTARVTAAELAAVSTVAMAVPAVGVPVPLSNDAFQGGRVTVPELAAAPAVAFSRPVGVGAVPVLGDAPQAGRVALTFDERGQTVPGLRGEEVASKLAQLTVLEEGRDDSTRSVDVKLPLSGSDESLTSNYPAAGPTTHVHQAALSLGLHSSHTCSGSDRHRAQAAYKPSPLGGKGSAADEIFSKLHPLGQEGQPNHSVAGVDVSHHADINLSGAALLAEDMAASVLTSMESPVFDRSRGISATAATDKAGPPAAEPSLISLIAPTLHAADQQVEKTEDVVKPATDGTGTPSLARATGHVAEEPKSPPEPEESDDVLSPLVDTAAKAKREAISRGLQTINNADLEELRELGSGTFGTVYHGKWRGSDVAIKRIKASCFAGRPSEQERLRADFWREACTLSQLHHPNVVAFYGVVPDGPGGTLATVTEYMVNGSMKQVMQKKDRTIDRRKRLLIAMDAAFGMEYLHLKNIVHFDLKCENLLVNMRDPQRPVCKVGDLGLSKVKHQTMVSGGVRGTLPWMAPELLNGQAALVTDKVDVYSFGIVMWELLTGDEPYASMHYGAIIGGIVNDSLRPEIPHWCEPAWRSLMERCWSADPAERPSFSDIASELRTMSAHPKAHGHGQNPGQNQGQAQGVGQGQTQASGQVQRQVSPPRAT